jgi:hypothetical protein
LINGVPWQQDVAAKSLSDFLTLRAFREQRLAALTIISKSGSALAPELHWFYSQLKEGSVPMLKLKTFPILAGATALGALALAATPAPASLMADGITYTLFETTTANPLVDNFDLHITGINGASDTELGRSGVNGIAFGTSSINFASATAPAGFTFELGGLNSSGCNGSGAFFCFAANTTPPTSPALTANSTLDFDFSVTVSSGTFSGFADSFKIDWIGNKNNYDLVSLPLPATPAVPAPLIGHGLLVLLAVGGVLFGSRLLEGFKNHHARAA